MNDNLVVRRNELVTLIDKFKPAIQKIIPKHLSAEKLVKLAHISLTKNPTLLECEPMSIIKCIMIFSQLGLDFDSPLGGGHLIPFRDKKSGKTICTPIIGYRGLLDLARRSGSITAIEARAVFALDRFNYELGLSQKLVHVPNLEALGNGKAQLVAVYAIARFANGFAQFEVMSKGEIEQIRINSRNGDGMIWQGHYVEMAKKTVLRRLCKMLPASAELAAAIHADDSAEAGEVPLFDSECQIVVEEEVLPDEKPTKQQEIAKQLMERKV